MLNPTNLIHVPPGETLRLSLAEIAAGRLEELNLMIAYYNAQNGTARFEPRRLLACGHPAVCLRANVDGSKFCLACRRMEAPAERRSRPEMDRNPFSPVGEES